MAIKVFILGRPGSGKSTAAHQIMKMAQNRGWSTMHVNDYPILQEMARADAEHTQFRPKAHNGFDVLDFSVLDTVLKQLEQSAQEHMSSAEIITIEFARHDYSKAFKQFSPNFLRDAYFLFIEADIKTCLSRIHGRVAHPTTVDDHPSLSDDIFEMHYRKDNRPYINYSLRTDSGISKWIQIIDNMGSQVDFIKNINRFINVVFVQEVRVLSHALTLQNTGEHVIPFLQDTNEHEALLSINTDIEQM